MQLLLLLCIHLIAGAAAVAKGADACSNTAGACADIACPETAVAGTVAAAAALVIDVTKSY